jgi:hypothetical protein
MSRSQTPTGPSGRTDTPASPAADHRAGVRVIGPVLGLHTSSCSRSSVIRGQAPSDQLARTV